MSKLLTAKEILELGLIKEQIKARLKKGNETKRWIALLSEKIKNAKTQKEMCILSLQWAIHVPKEYDYLLRELVPEGLR